MIRAIPATLVALTLLAAAPAGAVIYVDQNACGYGDNGTSWSDGFHSIQMAIEFAAGGEDKEIWVADGVYAESLSLYDGIALYGGFTGCSEGEETDRSQRDPAAAKTVIDADGAPHAVTIEKVKGVTLDGFVIRNAMALGISCGNSSDITIVDNEIVNNGSEVPDMGGMGVVNPGSLLASGGISCRRSKARIARNRIAGNKGAIGGVYLEATEGEIVGNTIAHNRGVYGGGVACVKSWPAIVNNLIVDNHGPSGAGVLAEVESRPTLINNTIVANRPKKPDQVGGVLLFNDEATIVNCILWGNGRDLKGGAAKHCIIQKGGPDGDNLRADPLFVNPAKGDYRLKPGSPAIDAGDTPAVKDHTTDLAGGPRVCDGDGKDGPQVDIGAYEHCPKTE